MVNRQNMHPYFFEKRPKNCYFHWSKKVVKFYFLWSNPSNTHSAPCILQHVWILHNDSYFPIYYKNSKFEVGLQDFLEGTVQYCWRPHTNWPGRIMGNRYWQQEHKVGIPETVKISWFAWLEWRYVWGHILCRFRRGNDEDM
jgi:hypothetical protein